MKRFLINDMRLYYDSAEIALRNNPGCEIVEIEDTKHEQYLPILTENLKIDENSRDGRTIREVYKVSLNVGDCLYMLFRDSHDNHYYDYLRYKLICRNRYIEPVLWSIIDIEKFVKTVLFANNIVYQVIEIHKCGDKNPISKPKELKGIKQAGTYKLYRKSGTIQFFVNGNDVYMKCSDYFSPSWHNPKYIGTPLSVRCEALGITKQAKKFIYDDSWGDIVLQQKAWVKFSNLVPALNLYRYDKVANICADLICEYHKFTRPLETEWISALTYICKTVQEGLSTNT